MKEKLSAAGSVVAAVLASSCCWGPLLLAGLGASGAGFASALAPFRLYLNGLTVAFLVGAWYLTLRKKPATAAAGASCCASEASCRADGGRRRSILLLSGVSVFALGMLFFPQLSAAVAKSRPTAPVAAVSGEVESVTLQVQGMTCEACEGHLEDALLKVPGVVSAEVSYQTASARASFQQGKVSSEQLKAAVAKTGYRVTSVTPPALATSSPKVQPGEER